MDYVINKNAKNAWIRDNDDTMDLSPETDAGTVYLNNGRTLEQELGEGSMVSNVVTVNSAMSKVIDGTYDGAYESCVFKGQTKWIDNDTNEILDGFVADRNLSLIDVKIPILRNVGKNLFSFQGKEESRYYRATSGDPVGHSSVDSYCVSVLPNMTYTITITGKNSIAHISYWTKGKHYVGGFPNISDAKAKTFTTSSQCHYVKFSLHKEGITSCQFEKSSVATPYEPHKSNALTTSEEIILRSLPNGVQDTYNPLTGEYVKRVGEVVLNNDKKWSKTYRADSTIVSTFQLQLDDLLTRAEGNVDDLIIDKIFTSQSHAIWDKNIEGIHNKKNYLFVNINNSRMNGDTVDSFKSWLLSNPIKVQYELAEPIIKKVEPKGHPFAYESGHVILESGYQSQSLLPIMDYSTVVNRTGQIKSIGEQSLRQDKQINKLEQMLVGNIIAMNYNNTLLKLNLTMNEVK